MAWQFEPGEALPDAFRRVAREEIAKIRADLTSCERDRNKAIHQARRRFKRLRALLRLAKPSLGAEFAVANRRWRDAGRTLSAKRDAAVLAASFDAMVERCHDMLPKAELNRLRAYLRNRAPAGEAGDKDDDAPLQEVLGVLDAAEDDFVCLVWPNRTKELSRGLRQSQARLRKSWKAARDGADPHAMHEWRKRLKDQMAQLGLFRKVAPDDLKARRKDQKQLAEVLGEERDLLLLCEGLDGPVPRGTQRMRDLLLEEIAVRRQELRAEALRSGGELSSQNAKRFAEELARRWGAAAPSEAPQRRRKAKAALSA
jgi:CHAD domain-containing protein